MEWTVGFLQFTTLTVAILTIKMGSAPCPFSNMLPQEVLPS